MDRTEKEMEIIKT